MAIGGGGGVLPWCVNKNMADPMIRTIMLALVLFATSAAARAQTLFAPVEYVTGDREWKCHGRCLGTLAIDEQFIRLTERRKTNPRVIFSLPLSTITRATNRVESAAASVTFGVAGLTATGRDELLVITAETAEYSETFVFKVAKHASDGMAAKIEFAARKAKD
jgi:hypothetical protein